MLSNYSKNNRDKDIKSIYESEWEYKQLLEDLNFNDSHAKKHLSSQKFNNQDNYSEISEG